MQRTGFSLIEICIILVILALVVGAITAGRSMMRSAELRNVAISAENYITAMNVFRQKYNALPGDMPNATSLWGATDNDPTACSTTAVTTKTTCNGNGNGRIEVGTGLEDGEDIRVWQHLRNAELTEPTACIPTPGIGCLPESKMKNIVHYPNYVGTTVNSLTTFDGDYGHALVTMKHDEILFLPPIELWEIDKKIDDGKPAHGKLRIFVLPAGLASGVGSCSTTTDPANLSADYAIDQDAIGCAIIFPQIITDKPE